MVARLLLRPHARVLRRGDDSAQVGLVQHDGLVLTGLTAAELELVEDLRRGVDADALGRRPGRLDAARVEELLARLRRHGLLDEAPDHRDGRPHPADAEGTAWAGAYGRGAAGADVTAGRAARRVVVAATGGVAEAVAAALRESGVGRVSVGRVAADHADHLLRRGEGVAPDLLVLVAAGGVPLEAGEPWRRRGVPHLPVVVDGHRLTVGPLVADRGPCLRCLDLHRCDRDPAWPVVLRQLRDDPPHGPDGDAVLRRLAAGNATALALTLLDGLGHVPEGLAVDTGLPVPTVLHRRWRPHPRCPCARARPVPAPAARQ